MLNILILNFSACAVWTGYIPTFELGYNRKCTYVQYYAGSFFFYIKVQFVFQPAPNETGKNNQSNKPSFTSLFQFCNANPAHM